VFVIHGYPGENNTTTADTISLLRQLGDSLSRVSLFRFVPLPGTQVYEQAAVNRIRGTHLQPDWDGDWGLMRAGPGMRGRAWEWASRRPGRSAKVDP
jgi:hypothetical protein